MSCSGAPYGAMVRDNRHRRCFGIGEAAKDLAVRTFGAEGLALLDERADMIDAVINIDPAAWNTIASSRRFVAATRTSHGRHGEITRRSAGRNDAEVSRERPPIPSQACRPGSAYFLIGSRFGARARRSLRQLREHRSIDRMLAGFVPPMAAFCSWTHALQQGWVMNPAVVQRDLRPWPQTSLPKGKRRALRCGHAIGDVFDGIHRLSPI